MAQSSVVPPWLGVRVGLRVRVRVKVKVWVAIGAEQTGSDTYERPYRITCIASVWLYLPCAS
eukprot:scaffold81924_cov52-Phaeocystis_antarctica.AAC.2